MKTIHTSVVKNGLFTDERYCYDRIDGPDDVLSLLSELADGGTLGDLALWFDADNTELNSPFRLADLAALSGALTALAAHDGRFDGRPLPPGMESLKSIEFVLNKDGVKKTGRLNPSGRELTLWRQADSPVSQDATLDKLCAAASTDAPARKRLHEEAERSRREKRLLPELRPRRRRRRFLTRLILLLCLVLVIVVLLAIFLPKLQESLRVNVELPVSFAELLPDEELGYNKLAFQEAILGETREKSELVVLEQDVQVTTEISHALANIALFEKSQTLISYGTGVYAVDLSGIGAAQIAMDETARIITVSIPRARLAYVNFDVTKTESGETHRALFGFGDIKLTTEQLTLLETSVESAMREKLSSSEALSAADERALLLVRELLDPLVKSVSPDFSVKAVMDN